MKDRHEWYDPVSNRELACGVSGDPDAAYTELKHGECYEPKSELVREILRLAAEVERLRAEREWRPIETGPKDGTPILVCIAGPTYYPDKVSWDGYRWVIHQGRRTVIALDKDPTHWMPLPEPPDEEAKAGKGGLE